jgi:PKD repeat protein
VISWRWDFGDGEVGVTNVSTTQHEYAGKGVSYTVTLTVTGPHGVSAPYTFVITTRS